MTSSTTTGAMASASELADRVCHEEQMVIWSGEIMGSLSMGGYFREDWSYEDTISASATVTTDIRNIVESAFDHPELNAAALAAPAPVVPEEVREAYEFAEQAEADASNAPQFRELRTGQVLAEDGFRRSAAKWVRTLLATTPSKPVGDGPEASAPPAGGGAVEECEGCGSRETIEAIQAKGFLSCCPERKMRSLAAAPTAPEAAAGGEREIVLPHPLHSGKPYPARVVLLDLAGQEGCDGEPYDTMQRLAEILSAPSEAETAGGDFQARVQAFMRAVAGDDATDVPERRDRFAEEAMELTQALGADREAMHQLVDYVFGRPVGEPAAEMGGTAVTLAGLAAWTGLDMAACGEAELARCNTPAMIAKIRSKRSNRHGRGALPGTLPEPTPSNAGAEGGQS